MWSEEQREGNSAISDAWQDQMSGKEAFVRIARWPAHDTVFFPFGFEDERANRIDDHFEKGYLDWPQHQRQVQQKWGNGKPCDRHMDREDETYGFADIVINAAAEPNGDDDGAEIILNQDDGRSLPCYVRAALAHGDADMGGL